MAKIKVKCPNGHEFYMEDYERKACPKCGKVAVGPKAKQLTLKHGPALKKELIQN